MRRLTVFCISLGLTCFAALVAAVRFVMELFAPFEHRMFAASPSPALSMSGASFDPAMLVSLRHEAGVPRRSAPRHV